MKFLQVKKGLRHALTKLKFNWFTAAKVMKELVLRTGTGTGTGTGKYPYYGYFLRYWYGYGYGYGYF